MEPDRLTTRWCIALLVAASLAVYANSFGGVFLYDDLVHIVGNQRIRSIGWHLWGARPLVDLTLAINYRLGGLDTWGYHAVNVTVHLLAALTLFGLVRRTLQLERYRQALGARADLVALSVALLWMVHPLQTESVTYLIQRGEAMAGLFYLLVLYCMVRAEESPRPARWLGAAVAACAAGMCAKPVLVTAPVVALLFDLLILGRGAGAIIRRRWGLYAGLLAMMVLLPATGTIGYIFGGAGDPNRTAGFSYTPIAPVDYALTQPGVILHYLRLVVWPRPLCLDYGWPVATSLGAALGPLLVLGSLLAGSILSWRRRPWLAFLGLSFFAILAPTSSIVPVAHPAVEHRMYLPLAAAIAAAVLGATALVDRLCRRRSAEALAGRIARLVVVAATAGLALVTVDRNADYRDPERMWRRLVADRPQNANGWGDLAYVLSGRGELVEAEQCYQESLRLRPQSCWLHDNYANLLLGQQRWADAARHATLATRLCPHYAPGHATLGNALIELGLVEPGLQSLRVAVQVAPRDHRAHSHLARGLIIASGLVAAEGPVDSAMLDEAVSHLVVALRLEPGFDPARKYLADALLATDDIDAAAARYPEARDVIAPAQSLAWVMAAVRDDPQGRSPEAIRCLRLALELDPSNGLARQLLIDAPHATAAVAE